MNVCRAPVTDLSRPGFSRRHALGASLAAMLLLLVATVARPCGVGVSACVSAWCDCVTPLDLPARQSNVFAFKIIANDHQVHLVFVDRFKILQHATVRLMDHHVQ